MPNEVDAACAVRHLASAVERRLADEGVRGVQVLPLDRDGEGLYKPRAGLAVGRERVVRAHYASRSIPGLLVIGMKPALPELERAELATHLEWPGLVQLAYGTAWEDIVSAAKRAAEGARYPLPRGVLAPVEDILRLTSEVRHWLGNRLRNTEGAVDIFERVIRGEIRLHPSHLKPVSPVSREHMDMLDRLWAREKPALELAPRSGGVSPVRSALGTFTRRWEDIEVARARLRDAEHAAAETVALLLQRHNEACDALREAIAASRELDDELKATREH